MNVAHRTRSKGERSGCHFVMNKQHQDQSKRHSKHREDGKEVKVVEEVQSYKLNCSRDAVSHDQGAMSGDYTCASLLRSTNTILNLSHPQTSSMTTRASLLPRSCASLSRKAQTRSSWCVPLLGLSHLAASIDTYAV